MTSAAVVLPDAAVRMLRAVAGRRALQVVLVLAGLLALGFLCGERAHAADGVPAPGRVESAKPVRSAEPVRERVAGPAREGANRTDDVRRAAVEPVARAAEPVVRNARGAVRPVVDGAAGVLGGASQRALPEAPALPDFPEKPTVPSIPTAPGVPELPEPGSGAGSDTGDGVGVGADVGVEPQSPRAGQSEATARARAESSYGTGTGTRTGISGDRGSGGAHRTGYEPSPSPTPFPSAPGDPARTLGGQSAGDGGSTRHGDPCAASLDSRAPVRLLQGAGAGQVPAPIRERHRDIPEFPG
ncbi:hypothetical protein ACWGH2_19690 [Streptomyces sp. NPDC054871]